MNKFFKVALASNLAGLFRAFRYGPREAARRLADAYEVVNPFGGPVEASPEVVRQYAAIPSVDLDQLVSHFPIFRIDGRHRYVDGALPQRDLMALLALLIDWKPESILEIGTFNGATTTAMALNVPQAIVHTVDLPLDYDLAKEEPGAIPKDDFHLIQQRRVGEAYKSLPGITNVVQHLVDSAKWDFAPVKGTSFFFIDGAHTYEYVKNDTEKCLAIAAPRSRFLLHDCDERHADIVRYVSELAGQGIPVFKITNTSLAFFDRK